MNSDDVSTVQWLAALGEVEKLDPKFIIPGHGRASTQAKQAIAFTRDYIEHVRSAMAGAVKDWTDFDKAYDADRLVEIQGYAGLRGQQSRQRLSDLSGAGAIAVQS